MMSDLFVEMQHFAWLLKTLLQLVPVVIGGQDDDILLQSLVVGLCRAAAICRAVSCVGTSAAFVCDFCDFVILLFCGASMCLHGFKKIVFGYTSYLVFCYCHLCVRVRLCCLY